MDLTWLGDIAGVARTLFGLGGGDTGINLKANSGNLEVKNVSDTLTTGAVAKFAQAVDYQPYIIDVDHTIPASHQASFSGYVTVNDGVTLTINGILYIDD